MALGNRDIVLSTSHVGRKQNLVALVRVTELSAAATVRTDLAAVSFGLLDRYHPNAGRDLHSDNEGVEKIHRVVHRHGLGKTRFDQRPDESGYQRRRQDGWSHRPRSDPALGCFVIGIKGGLLCQFVTAAGEEGLGVRARSKDPAYAGRLSDEIVPDQVTVVGVHVSLFRHLEQVPHWLV